MSLDIVIGLVIGVSLILAMYFLYRSEYRQAVYVLVAAAITGALVFLNNEPSPPIIETDDSDIDDALRAMKEAALWQLMESEALLAKNETERQMVSAELAVINDISDSHTRRKALIAVALKHKAT